MDTKPVEVRFQLMLFGGRIELNTYNEIVQQIQIALDEQERAITGHDPHASWILDTAAVIPVSAAPNGTSQEDLRQIVRETRNEFVRALPHGAEDVGSQSRSPRAREAVRHIISQLGNEIDSIVLSGDDIDEVTIERSVAEQLIHTLIEVAKAPTSAFTRGDHYEDIATIEGVIDLVSTRTRNPRFSVREHWTGRHITAEFDESMMEQVTTAFKLGIRAEVTGLVRFRGTGDPVSIREVTRIWWPEDEPRDILEFEGMLPGLINGMDEGDFIRQLRSSDADE